MKTTNREYSAWSHNNRLLIERLCVCPFCGNVPQVSPHIDYTGEVIGFEILCGGACELAKVTTGFYEGAFERARDAWNKRITAVNHKPFDKFDIEIEGAP